MSNFFTTEWEALERKLHHAVEFASNCAGPDGAKERVKSALSAVIAEAKKLAAPVIPVAEQVAEDAISAGLQAAAPAIEAKLGEPVGSFVEAGLAAAVAGAESTAEGAVTEALAPTPETK